VNNLRDKELLEKLGQRLKDLRMQKGLTLEQLAYESEMELSQVHRIEKSKVNPTITTLSAIAKGLDMPLSELLKSL
jgi:transcriptional regulator with XRE-family HTH domain